MSGCLQRDTSLMENVFFFFLVSFSNNRLAQYSHTHILYLILQLGEAQLISDWNSSSDVSGVSQPQVNGWSLLEGGKKERIIVYLSLLSSVWCSEYVFFFFSCQENCKGHWSASLLVYSSYGLWASLYVSRKRRNTNSIK